MTTRRRTRVPSIMFAIIVTLGALAVLPLHGLADEHESCEQPSRHPSGKDRCKEEGGSGTQGSAAHEPDDDGRGPERDEGGRDQDGGGGGRYTSDQDGNNGCGNDQDFDDDNEGLCGDEPEQRRAGDDENGNSAQAKGSAKAGQNDSSKGSGTGNDDDSVRGSSEKGENGPARTAGKKGDGGPAKTSGKQSKDIRSNGSATTSGSADEDEGSAKESKSGARDDVDGNGLQNGPSTSTDADVTGRSDSDSDSDGDAVDTAVAGANDAVSPPSSGISTGALLAAPRDLTGPDEAIGVSGALGGPGGAQTDVVAQAQAQAPASQLPATGFPVAGGLLTALASFGLGAGALRRAQPAKPEPWLRG